MKHLIFKKDSYDNETIYSEEQVVILEVRCLNLDIKKLISDIDDCEMLRERRVFAKHIISNKENDIHLFKIYGNIGNANERLFEIVNCTCKFINSETTKNFIYENEVIYE